MVMVAVMVAGEGGPGLENFGETSFNTFPVRLLNTNPEAKRPAAASCGGVGQGWGERRGEER